VQSTEAGIGIGIWGERRSREHGKRVDASKTLDIADPAALGVLPGSAGSMQSAAHAG